MSRQSIPLSELLIACSQCLADIEHGRSLTEALAKVPDDKRPATQAVSTYALRHWGLAKAWRSQALKTRPKDRWLHSHIALSLLLLDAALLHDDPAITASWQAPLGADCPRYTPYTLVDQAVQAVSKQVSGKYAVGLLNAILRRFQRERDSFIAAVATDTVAQWNHPKWWIALVQNAYPQSWQDILQAAQVPPRLVLRVNQRTATVAQVLTAFKEAGQPAQWLGEQAIMLEQPAVVTSLPGYGQGWWSVQDISAQVAVPLLPLNCGDRVLDACAAPGGKTSHILERSDVVLTALDHDAKRLALVARNLERLKLASTTHRLIAADARDLSNWWDGRAFNAILADVPCTASGVVRRHPDIAWLRRESDLSNPVKLQREILDALWSTLAVGGHLLLVTCSVFPAEGEMQAQAFMKRHADAVRLTAPGQRLPESPGTQSLSGQDGFFYALFQRLKKS